MGIWQDTLVRLGVAQAGPKITTQDRAILEYVQCFPYLNSANLNQPKAAKRQTETVSETRRSNGEMSSKVTADYGSSWK